MLVFKINPFQYQSFGKGKGEMLYFYFCMDFIFQVGYYFFAGKTLHCRHLDEDVYQQKQENKGRKNPRNYLKGLLYDSLSSQLNKFYKFTIRFNSVILSGP